MRHQFWVPFAVLSLCPCAWADTLHTEVKAKLEYSLTDHGKLAPALTVGWGSRLAEAIQSKLKGTVKVDRLDFDEKGSTVRIEMAGNLEGPDDGSHGADRIRKAAHEAGSALPELKATLSRVSIEMKRHEFRGDSDDAHDAATANEEATDERRETKSGSADASQRRIEKVIREIKMEREVDREKVRPAPRLDIVVSKDGKSTLSTFVALDVPLVRVMDELTKLVPMSFVLHPETMHKGVWVSLKGVTVDEGLGALADSAGLLLERRGTYFTFVPRPVATPGAPQGQGPTGH